MNKKMLLISEITGFFVIAFGAVFLWNIYEFSGKSTPAVIFGAVNNSVWEKAKCLSICYALYSIIQIFCVKPVFKQFVAAKTIGLSASLVTFIVFDYFIDFEADLIILAAAAIVGLACSYLLTCSSLNLRVVFAPMCFLLLLIFMMTFTFTAFAPKLGIFRDPYTGYYGIIPQAFDMGAVNLGVSFGV